MEDLLGIDSNEDPPIVESKSDIHDDFFTFRYEKSNGSKQEQLKEFLKSNDCDLNMLNNFPKLKQLFIQYNTPLPSSASVERLFSVGGSVLTPQRAHLSDDIVEQQLLLKLNKQFR